MSARVAALLALTLLLLYSTAGAQLTGRVVDDHSHSGIRAARVIVRSNALSREAYTDGQGRYAFTGLPAGEYDVYASHVSYEQVSLRVLLGSDQSIAVDIPLEPQPLVLAAVVVPIAKGQEPSAGEHDFADTLGAALRTPLAYESRLTGGLGELAGTPLPDQSPNPGQRTPRTLHIVGSGGFRGVAMIDDMILGAPLHLGGILPQLTPNGLSGVSLQTGGAAARYDGGSSYILQYRTRAARADQLSVRGDVGMLSMDVFASAPVAENAAVNVSLRRVNDDLLEALTPSPFGYQYRDALVRLDWRTGGSSGLQALLFGTHEGVRIPRDLGYDDVQWGNRAVGLTWSADTLGSGLEIGGSFTRGRARLPLLSAPDGRLTATIDRGSASIAQHWRLPSGRAATGLQYEHALVAREGRAGSEACTFLLPCSSVQRTTISAFGDLTTLLSPSATVHAGLRARAATDGAVHLLPRLSLAYALARNTVTTLSFGRFSQLAVEQPQPEQFLARHELASQLELEVKHTARRLTLAGSGRLLHVEVAPGRRSLLPGADGFMATAIGPARLSAGFTISQRETVVRDTLNRHVERQVFFAVTTTAGDVHLHASIVHGSDLPLTSIVLDGVTPPAPEPYGPTPAPVPSGRQQHTRLDFGMKGLWQLQLGARTVRLAPYARLINPFHSDALFYYQPSGSADLQPLSALPAVPVLGIEWTF